ncbi:unnamed protein product [Cuscuta europaea]|uniref:Transmembrane protein 208 n=1 Tax=Cuscuta europaea TaxID=41803 RepID=A0A9P0ZRJ7_CUSEU|nr:unnamed protein product [Cuscuta europaea]
MVNQGAKKRKEENIRHMRTLHHTILFCNVVYLLVRFGIFYSSLSWMHGGGLVFTSIAYFLPYQQLTAMAKPSYGSDGELLDGGYDMSTGGVCGYLHDVIYITCFVQLASILSGKFWYTYLVVSFTFSFFPFLTNISFITVSLLIRHVVSKIKFVLFLTRSF